MILVITKNIGQSITLLFCYSWLWDLHTITKKKWNIRPGEALIHWALQILGKKICFFFYVDLWKLVNVKINIITSVVVFSHVYTSTYMQNQSQRHNDKGWEKTSLKKYTSHFICNVCVWEGVGDWTKFAIYWPPLLWPLALCLSRSPGWLSLLHLITNWSPKLHRGSRGPLRPGVAFPTTSHL